MDIVKPHPCSAGGDVLVRALISHITAEAVANVNPDMPSCPAVSGDQDRARRSCFQVLCLVMAVLELPQAVPPIPGTVPANKAAAVIAHFADTVPNDLFPLLRIIPGKVYRLHCECVLSIGNPHPQSSNLEIRWQQA